MTVSLGKLSVKFNFRNASDSEAVQVENVCGNAELLNWNQNLQFDVTLWKDGVRWVYECTVLINVKSPQSTMHKLQSPTETWMQIKKSWLTKTHKNQTMKITTSAKLLQPNSSVSVSVRRTFYTIVHCRLWALLCECVCWCRFSSSISIGISFLLHLDPYSLYFKLVRTHHILFDWIFKFAIHNALKWTLSPVSLSLLFSHTF